MKVSNGIWSQFRAAVLFVAAAASTEKGFPAFNSVQVEIFNDEQLALVATDRFRIHWAGVGCGSDLAIQYHADTAGLINARELVAAVKPARADSYALELDGDTWTLTVDDVTTAGRLVRADFPKWRHLADGIGQDIPAGAYEFNPALLGGTLTAAAKAFKTDKAARLHWGEKATKPVRLSKLNDNDSAGALVMPCRIGA